MLTSILFLSPGYNRLHWMRPDTDILSLTKKCLYELYSYHRVCVFYELVFRHIVYLLCLLQQIPQEVLKRKGYTYKTDRLEGFVFFREMDETEVKQEWNVQAYKVIKDI